MLCISLWQPWASLWVARRKIHETRHWAPPVTIKGMPVLGATIGVHAAKRLIARDDLDPLCARICDDEFGLHWERTLPRGLVIGAGRLVACWQTAARRRQVTQEEQALGDWSDGRYAWQLIDTVQFARPIPWRGQQAVFDVPDEAIAGRVTPFLGALL